MQVIISELIKFNKLTSCILRRGFHACLSIDAAADNLCSAGVVTFEWCDTVGSVTGRACGLHRKPFWFISILQSFSPLTTHTHTTVLRLSGFCPGQPRWAGTRETPSHTYHDHRSSPIRFIHASWSTASSSSNPRARQSPQSLSKPYPVQSTPAWHLLTLHTPPHPTTVPLLQHMPTSSQPALPQWMEKLHLLGCPCLVIVKCWILGFMSVLELELLDVEAHSVFLRWKNYAPEARLLSWVVSYRKTWVLCFSFFVVFNF